MSSTATSRPRSRAVHSAHGKPTRVPSGAHITLAKRRVFCVSTGASKMNDASQSSANSGGGVHVLVVGSPPNVHIVEETAALCALERRHLLVLFRDTDVSGTSTNEDSAEAEIARVVHTLETVCDAIARFAPVLPFTPLLPQCGWDLQRARVRAESLASPGSDVVVIDTTDAATYAEGTSAQTETEPCVRNTLSPKRARRFSKVSVGGTFDRLHAGHRLLLCVAAAVTSQNGTLYIGVTGEALLATKAHKHKIEPYEIRAVNAENFVRSIWAPGYLNNSMTSDSVQIKTGPLDGNPPLAATVHDMSALVVSGETKQGGDAVNEARVDKNLKPLALIAVGVVGGHGDSLEEREKTKLSSSALRASEEGVIQ